MLSGIGMLSNAPNVDLPVCLCAHVPMWPLPVPMVLPHCVTMSPRGTSTADDSSVAPDGSFPYMVRLGAAVRAGFRPREMQTCRHRNEPGFAELGEWYLMLLAGFRIVRCTPLIQCSRRCRGGGY